MIAPPHDISPFRIRTSVPQKRLLVAALGYGTSFNDPTSPTDPRPMLARGRIESRNKKGPDELLEIRMMVERGFSGGPLFIAADASGNDATDVCSLDEQNLPAPEVVALCTGSLQSNHDLVGYEILNSF